MNVEHTGPSGTLEGSGREPGEVLDKVDTGFSVYCGSDFCMCHLGACRTLRCRRGLWGDCTMDGLTHVPSAVWLWGEASCAAQPEALLWPCAFLGSVPPRARQAGAFPGLCLPLDPSVETGSQLH